MLASNSVQYYLHAINYLTGTEAATPYEILDNYPGPLPIQFKVCGTFPPNGDLIFDPASHFQRSALLLIPSTHEVYVAFAAGGSELVNGWLMAFSMGSDGNIHRDDHWVTTPYGTGGGIWMDGAGPAAEPDGSYIYLSTANGTFDAAGVQNQNPLFDYSDSLLKITPFQPGSSTLGQAQYFTPSDVFVYQPPPPLISHGPGRCINDTDLGSGGVMLFPDVFYSNEKLMVTADKESQLYVVDRNNLTGFNSGGDQIVEEFQTPTPYETGQGFWGSPAYWVWGTNPTNRAIYYSVDATTNEAQGASNPPEPLTMYTVHASSPGPIVQSPYSKTGTVFCAHGGQPSVSSAPAPGGSYSGAPGTGIVWAYEDTNSQTPFACGAPIKDWGRAELHAYDASNVGTELYNSKSLMQTVSYPVKFATPMVFNGKVYIGTQYNPVNGNGINEPAEVDVFGLCGQNGQPACFAN